MSLSETIVAAIIGAIATISTAIVQLLRNRAPAESRPKKNRTRSVLATIALMIGCIVGGYAWSALRAVSAKEELTSTMQAEFSRQFAEFAARQSQAAAASSAAVAARNAGAGAAEALVHLPPCQISAQTADVGPVTCNESVAQTVTLCAAVPAAAETRAVRLQSRVPRSESPWMERDAGAPTLGSLHIGANGSEFPVSPELRSVCLDVSNWSVEDMLAVRLTVEYATPQPPAELTAAAPTAKL